MSQAIESHSAWTAPAWFCLRTQPKHEHIAAAHFRSDPDIEIYLPRIRVKRATRRGPVWFTEALFPNYMFARFELAACLRRVCHARGVRGVVHFGDRWPIVPEAVIRELRATVGADQVHVVRDELQPGEAVRIAGGVFDGLEAVVTRVMPSRERVAVLLEFLGRQTSVELPGEALIREGDERRRVL
jgi:transcriptional antiterminator RfaH